MTKHVMALTYAPKIEPVKDVRCTQTIRKGRRVTEGDDILFHDRIGKPYRSKWGWRLRVVVTGAINIAIYNTDLLQGVHFQNTATVLHWNHSRIDTLARQDFIEPPTGEELRDVLFKFNNSKQSDEPELYQIIRWKPWLK